mgnify:CR=1 FL=1
MHLAMERCILKKYIEDPRHIEFQILADKSEIDSSWRKRLFYSEKTSETDRRVTIPAISDEQRKKMGEIAVKAAKAAECRRGFVG